MNWGTTFERREAALTMLTITARAGRKETLTMTYKRTSSIAAGATLSLGLLVGAGVPAQATQTASADAPPSATTSGSVQEEIKQVDDSNLAFRLNGGDQLAADGTAIISAGGDESTLPQESVDSNGDAVDLRYAEEDGVVTINVLQKGAGDEPASTEPGTASTMALSDSWTCGLGTGGSAGTGAIAGGAAGASIGSVVPGAGTVAGWAIGTAIGGAVSGGAVGAATFC